MKSIMIFAAVMAASITPAMAVDMEMEKMRRDMEWNRMMMENRLRKQEQQLRNLEFQQLLNYHDSVF